MVIKASRRATQKVRRSKIERRNNRADYCRGFDLRTSIFDHRDVSEVNPHRRVVGIVPYQTTDGVNDESR